MNGRGGLYDLALLIGDAAIDTPIHWDLGQVLGPPVRLICWDLSFKSYPLLGEPSHVWHCTYQQ